ncbi:uncharacterized protein [Paramisgurnus dabryanus]|uniref:uncharacterized protein n=1 Tax=Paramisgurnus dabryanus TaxID=90735 RepID=UPI003CCF4CEA
MGDKLKRDIQNLQKKKVPPITSTPVSEDSDNTDIDLFDNTEQRRSRKRSALDSDDEEEFTGNKECDNSVLQRTSPLNTPVMLDGDVVKALKELPGLVASLKDVLESMDRGRSCSSSSSELSLADSSEMISLAESDVKVPRRMYDRLNKSRVSIFTQELVSLVFGKEKLARCTLTGKSGNQTSKDQLDPHKVAVVIDTVIKQFPNTTVSEVRALIRRMCNNEANSKSSRASLEI